MLRGEKSHYGIYEDPENDISYVWVALGSPSISKCVDELIKEGYEEFIYIATFGAISEEPQIGDIYVPTGAVRREGTSETYVNELYPAIPSFNLNRRVVEELKGNNIHFNDGIVWTEDGYHAHVDDLETKDKYQFEYWRDKGVFGIEMECSALFITSQIRNVESSAILTCNREWRQIRDVWKGEDVDWHIKENKVENSLDKSFGIALTVLKN
ncbi:MAG: hypothetical protein ABEK17_01820 [Candidatus Aenigmatarchaeota archaeon]